MRLSSWTSPRRDDKEQVSYQKPEAKHPVSLGGYKTTAERIHLRKHFITEIGAHLSQCVSNTVRPHLEFASLAWSPWSPSDQDVRMVTGIKGARYKDKCKVLGLQTLKNRRLQQDLTLDHKFIISDIDKSSNILHKMDQQGWIMTRQVANTSSLEAQYARTDKEVALWDESCAMGLADSDTRKQGIQLKAQI